MYDQKEWREVTSCKMVEEETLEVSPSTKATLSHKKQLESTTIDLEQQGLNFFSINTNSIINVFIFSWAFLNIFSLTYFIVRIHI